MSRPVNIDIRTTADTKGAEQATDALGQVKNTASESGSETTRVAADSGSQMMAMAGKVFKVVLAWKTLKATIRGLHRLLQEAGEQEVLDAKQAAVVRATGAAAGFTTGELKAMNAQLSELTRISDEAISQTQTLLLTFTNIRGDNFEAATRAALDLSAVMGGDSASAARMLARALDDPIQGLTALTRAGLTFDAQQQRVIRAMAEGGDIAGAQAEILAEVERRMGGAADAAGQTLKGALDNVKNAWGDARQAMGSYLGEIPIVRRAIDGLGQSFRDVSDALELWRDPTGELMNMRIQFQAMEHDSEALLESIRRLSVQDFGQLPTDAEALANYLKRMADEATRANTAIDTLARARADLALAEIDRKEASGEITKEDADRQRIQIRATTEKTAIERELTNLQEQVKIIEQRKAAARQQLEQAESTSRNRQEAYAEYTPEQAAALQDRYNQASTHGERQRVGQDIRVYNENRDRAAVEAQNAQDAYNSAADNVVELENMLARTRTELETARELADIRTRTVSTQADASMTRVGNREEAARRRREAEAIRQRMREIEQTKRTLPGELEDRVERERMEAEAAEQALRQAQSTGAVGGYSIRGGEGARRYAELERTAERERQEFHDAAESMQQSMHGLTQTMIQLASRLHDLEEQTKNAPQ